MKSLTMTRKFSSTASKIVTRERKNRQIKKIKIKKRKKRKMKRMRMRRT